MLSACNGSHLELGSFHSMCPWAQGSCACRMDEALFFDLPEEAERAQILAVYLNSYILKAGTTQGALPAIARLSNP